MPIDYSEYSDMGLEDEYVRAVKCKKCFEARVLIERELVFRGYTAREIRNVRELSRS